MFSRTFEKQYAINFEAIFLITFSTSSFSAGHDTSLVLSWERGYMITEAPYSLPLYLMPSWEQPRTQTD